VAKQPARKSERPIVPLKPGNAGGGKGPYFGSASEAGKEAEIGVSLATPDKIRQLQKKLYRKAKQEPDYRFYLLYDKVYREDILAHAWQLVREHNGAPGVDGISCESIEARGVEEWLAGIRKELHEQTYKPDPVRRVMIPKRGGVSGRSAFRRYATEWCKPQPSWCWSQSLKLTSSPTLMATGRSAVPKMRCKRSIAV